METLQFTHAFIWANFSDRSAPKAPPEMVVTSNNILNQMPEHFRFKMFRNHSMLPKYMFLEQKWPLSFGGLTFHFMGQIFQNIGHLGPRFI